MSPTKRKDVAERAKKYLERDDARKLRRLLDGESSPGELVSSARLGRRRGQNALHLAAKWNSPDCMGILLKLGCCDANESDRKGRLPLHLAAGTCLDDYRRSTMLELVSPLVSKTDLDRVDRDGVTCRQLLDRLRKRELEKSALLVDVSFDDSSDDGMDRLEQAREEETARRKREADWGDRLREEFTDDVSDAFGSSASSFAFSHHEEVPLETYDEWADRIYRAFREKRRPKLGNRVEKKQAAPPPEPPRKKLKLPPPPPTLRDKYLKFVQKCEQEASLRLKDLPFKLATPQSVIAETVFGQLGEEEGGSAGRAAVKRALLLWHPDKFEQRFGRAVDAEDRDDVMKVVVHVSQSLLAAGK